MSEAREHPARPIVAPLSLANLRLRFDIVSVWSLSRRAVTRAFSRRYVRWRQSPMSR
jgi:hypothetical protein